ncbi:MAG: hypothetical protein ABSF23_04425 [Terracidiphilus sp.]|jgi:hypothetical protein
MRNRLAGEVEDPVVAEALKNFKASVDAWSEAAYSRPRAAVYTLRHTWRLATGWALGLVIAAGSLAGWMAERHHRQEPARIAAGKAAQKVAQQQVVAQLPAAAVAPVPAATQQSNASTVTAEDEDLLASVDSDVSREVPAAMEPLAQLIDSNGAKQETQKKAGKGPLQDKGGEQQ